MEVARILTRTMENFAWQDAPLRNIQVPATAAAVYLVLVALLPRGLLKGRLDSVVATHNMILCIWSLVMFAGCLFEVSVRVRAEGVDWFFCELPATRSRGPLFFWSYLYYLSKFYELLDTVLSILNGSSLPFPRLHIFHHSCVLLMAWNWLEYSQTLQFGGLLFNTLVHVVMYYYYARKSLRLPTPWKRWVTRMQIVQFACSFILVCVTGSHLMRAECAGQGALLFNFAFNATLIVQFVGVLKGGAPRRDGAANGATNEKKRA